MESACFFGDLADFNNSPPYPNVLFVLCQTLMNSLPNNRIFLHIWQSFNNSPPYPSDLFILCQTLGEKCDLARKF